MSERFTCRQWTNITGNQTKYLVQVMPPGDIIAQVVAVVTSLQNMTNAAILYDDTFGNSSVTQAN